MCVCVARGFLGVCIVKRKVPSLFVMVRGVCVCVVAGHAVEQSDCLLRCSGSAFTWMNAVSKQHSSLCAKVCG